MKKKPGVMLYFDRMTFLDRLDDAQCGRLLRAIIGYARDGETPQISDPMLGMAWDMLRPVIDLDSERYEAKCEQNRRNILKRWDTTESNRIPMIPNTNTNQNQTQTESQTQTKTQNHSHSQKETARDFSDAESLLALRDARRREFEAEKARLAAAKPKGRRIIDLPESSAAFECAE